MQWYIAAILSALFAAITSILAKIGIKDVNSNLATAIRTSFVLVITWGIVFWQKTTSEIPNISKNSWIFLVLSAIATGLSWIFYFYALKLGEASKVAPIDKLSLVLTIAFAALILGEKITFMKGVGALLMTVGTIIIALSK
jgi:transporter family protein